MAEFEAEEESDSDSDIPPAGQKATRTVASAHDNGTSAEESETGRAQRPAPQGIYDEAVIDEFSQISQDLAGDAKALVDRFVEEDSTNVLLSSFDPAVISARDRLRMNQFRSTVQDLYAGCLDSNYWSEYQADAYTEELHARIEVIRAGLLVTYLAMKPHVYLQEIERQLVTAIQANEGTDELSLLVVETIMQRYMLLRLEDKTSTKKDYTAFFPSGNDLADRLGIPKVKKERTLQHVKVLQNLFATLKQLKSPNFEASLRDPATFEASFQRYVSMFSKCVSNLVKQFEGPAGLVRINGQKRTRDIAALNSAEGRARKSRRATDGGAPGKVMEEIEEISRRMILLKEQMTQSASFVDSRTSHGASNGAASRPLQESSRASSPVDGNDVEDDTVVRNRDPYYEETNEEEAGSQGIVDYDFDNQEPSAEQASQQMFHSEDPESSEPGEIEDSDSALPQHNGRRKKAVLDEIMNETNNMEQEARRKVPRRAKRPWTSEEMTLLITAVGDYGPQWSLLERKYGEHGTRELRFRTQVDLKDKARLIKQHYLEQGEYERCVKEYPGWEAVSIGKKLRGIHSLSQRETFAQDVESGGEDHGEVEGGEL